MRTNILLVAITVFWGIWGFANKNAVMRIGPFTAQWMYCVPYLIFLPIWYWLSRGKENSGPGIDGIAMFWVGTACVAAMLATLLMYITMETKAASTTMALTSAYPIIVLLFGVITKTEDFTFPKLICIFLIILGVIVLQVSGG